MVRARVRVKNGELKTEGSTQGGAWAPAEQLAGGMAALMRTRVGDSRVKFGVKC